jgi:transposase
MSQVIMVGCDLHDKSMLLKCAIGKSGVTTWSTLNNGAGRKRLIARLKELSEQHGNASVVFAYEASGQGFGLHDELHEAGITCHVLAPTKLATSVQDRRRKTDEADGLRILEALRGHVLAGNRLPTVWIPDHQTRDDREVVRMRLDVAQKKIALKAQIQSLLKRNRQRRPEGCGEGWTSLFWAWLDRLAGDDSSLGCGSRCALGSLLRQLRSLHVEEQQLDEGIGGLSRSPRYKAAALELMRLTGVGRLTAMVFLTEMGDLTRFQNRRQVAAYLGLAPSSYESGEQTDHKGHITHHGSARVRRVLCQAMWARVRTEPKERYHHERLVEKNPKRKKVAVVAGMRRLAILMWHRGRPAANSAAVGGGPEPATQRRPRQSRPAASAPARLRRPVQTHPKASSTKERVFSPPRPPSHR